MIRELTDLIRESAPPLSARDRLYAAEYSAACVWLTRRDDADAVAASDEALSIARRAWFAAGGSAESADGCADEAFADAVFYVRNA